jgi:molecular chaperone HtpG
MKKLMMMAVMLMAAVCASAQSDKTPVDAYFTTSEMPDMLNIVVNTDHKLVKDVLSDMENKTTDSIKPVNAEIAGLSARREALNQETKDKKWDEVPQDVKDNLSSTEKEIEEAKNKKTAIISEASKGNKVVHQLIDLALLKNGLLRGEALDGFIRRSVELILG